MFCVQPTHRRGRSLSEALTLEESEEGGLVISSVNSSSHVQDLKEGMSSNRFIHFPLLFFLNITHILTLTSKSMWVTIA